MASPSVQSRVHFAADQKKDEQPSDVRNFTADSGAISPLQRKVGLAFGVALVAIISIGALQYRTALQLAEDNRRVSHSQDVLRELEAVRTSLNRADAFLQSFVATDDTSYLSPYRQAVVDLRQHLRTLRMLSAGSPSQQQTEGTIEGSAAESIRALQAEADARNISRLSAERVLQLENPIRKATADVRTLAGDMQTQEFKVLREWREHGQQANNQTNLLILISTIVGCAFIVSAGIGLQLDLAERGRAEVGRVHAYKALQGAKEELEREVQAKAEAQIRLENSERSLRQLSLELLRTQDEERRRIGRELHDSVGQYLAVLKMGLDSLRKSIFASRKDERGQEKKLDECTAFVDETIKEVRTMSYLLHPPLLESCGLISAIPTYIEGFSKRSGIKVTLDIPSNFGRLSDNVELAIFRVLQESLTNVHRHSGSPTANVRLLAEGGALTLEISDQGRGIAPAKLTPQSDLPATLGVGLQGMKERMRQLGGKLELKSGTGGTTIRAAVPHVTATSARAASA
jgi:signal transduction histidine kinase